MRLVKVGKCILEVFKLVEDEEIKFSHDNTYKSCCLTIDKRALNYFAQAFFSGSIIAFCIAMLSTNTDCAVQYLNL